jgi:DNA-binding transcriptional MerR regulator
MHQKAEPKVVLPPIPAKRYFTIGEVSELCGVKPHVLRYWEQEFTQLRPMKRRGNRRYYQHHEVLLIRRIRELLYEEGFTISGARNRLGEAAHNGRGKAAAAATAECSAQPAGASSSQGAVQGQLDLGGDDLRSIRSALRDAIELLRQPELRARIRSACVSKDPPSYCYNPQLRGVAQPGSALAWGARGRVFESLRPDQQNQRVGSHKGPTLFHFLATVNVLVLPRLIRWRDGGQMER